MLSWLENSPFSVWAKGSSLLGWPTLLTIHVLGTALVIGLIFIIHLRLLGLFDGIAYTSLKRLFPALWTGLAVQLLSGAALWVTKATQYTTDVAFLVKLVLVIAGFVLALVLYGAVKREAISWAADTAAPRRYEVVVPALVVWAAVLIFARLTAFLGALPHDRQEARESNPTVITEAITEGRKTTPAVQYDRPGGETAGRVGAIATLRH